MIYKFNELDSTNKYVLDNYESLEDLDVVYALHQTDGRGRLGRSWFDDDSICMSIVLKNNLNYDLGLISFVAASSVYGVLSKYVKGAMIKWPNDILIDDKKICGILCQSKILDNNVKCIVVGIGLNTNTVYLHEEIKDIATSLYLLTNNNYDNEKIVIEILKEFQYFYGKFMSGDKEFIEICRKKNYLLNKKIAYFENGMIKDGVVIDIAENGNLIIISNNIIFQLNSGEVTLKK